MTIDTPKSVEEEIDHALEESFPASDPPSWSSGKRHASSLPDSAEPEAQESDDQEPTSD